MESAIALCRSITQTDSANPGISSKGGGSSGAAVVKNQVAAGCANFKAVLGFVTNFITSAELVRGGAVSTEARAGAPRGREGRGWAGSGLPRPLRQNSGVALWSGEGGGTCVHFLTGDWR